MIKTLLAALIILTPVASYADGNYSYVVCPERSTSTAPHSIDGMRLIEAMQKLGDEYVCLRKFIDDNELRYSQADKMRQKKLRACKKMEVALEALNKSALLEVRNDIYKAFSELGCVK